MMEEGMYLEVHLEGWTIHPHSRQNWIFFWLRTILNLTKNHLPTHPRESLFYAKIKSDIYQTFRKVPTASKNLIYNVKDD